MIEYERLQLEIKEIEQDLAAGKNISAKQEDCVRAVITLLDEGKLRVIDPLETSADEVVVHSWVKQAILQYFRISKMEITEVGPYVYHDKIPLKSYDESCGVRVVPPAVARYGSYLAPGVVLMPSYVNIGAYVGEGTMVDTWATVGSCAQVGKNVHLSGGVGLGGVLEPASARPVVIEDGAFIGSRCIIVEGVRVRERAVLAANVTLTSSTPIYDMCQSPMKIYRGEVPSHSVVVPGVREKEMPGGRMLIGCAYILGKRKASTDDKTSLNDVLRDHALSV